MKEIRFHGRAGQGSRMASEILAEAFVLEGKHVSAFPMFGAERRGAPVSAFLRFDDKPVRETTQIYQPDCVVIIDPAQIKPDTFRGIRQGNLELEGNMDFKLSEQQLMFKRAIRNFAEKEIAPLVDEAEEKEEFPVELFPKMGKLGYLSVAYPVEYGGGGMGKLGECIEHEELARVCLGISSGIAAHSTLTGSILCYHASEEQRNKYFFPAMKGEKITAFAITEPNAGSDMAAIETKAIRQGEDYLLNGNKIFTSNGPIADFVLVAAYTDKSKGSRGGMSVFLVEKGTPGFTVSRKLKKLGLHSEETGELVFENCHVPAENLVGEEGKGWQYIHAALNGTRLPYAARALGLAEAAYEAALEYAKNRVQFGQPIGKLQAIAFKLVRIAMEIEAARWLIYNAAWLYDQGKECVKEVSMAKLFSSEMVLHVVNEAAHIFGGYGFMMEFPIQRYLRDARLSPIGLGTSEIQEMIIARRIGL